MTERTFDDVLSTLSRDQDSVRALITAVIEQAAQLAHEDQVADQPEVASSQRPGIKPGELSVFSHNAARTYANNTVLRAQNQLQQAITDDPKFKDITEGKNPQATLEVLQDLHNKAARTIPSGTNIRMGMGTQLATAAIHETMEHNQGLLSSSLLRQALIGSRTDGLLRIALGHERIPTAGHDATQLSYSDKGVLLTYARDACLKAIDAGFQPEDDTTQADMDSSILTVASLFPAIQAEDELDMSQPYNHIAEQAAKRRPAMLEQRRTLMKEYVNKGFDTLAKALRDEFRETTRTESTSQSTNLRARITALKTDIENETCLLLTESKQDELGANSDGSDEQGSAATFSKALFIQFLSTHPLNAANGNNSHIPYCMRELLQHEHDTDESRAHTLLQLRQDFTRYFLMQILTDYEGLQELAAEHDYQLPKQYSLHAFVDSNLQVIEQEVSEAVYDITRNPVLKALDSAGHAAHKTCDNMISHIRGVFTPTHVEL